MLANDQHIRLRLDGHARCCLTVITALLVILVVGLWAERSPMTQNAAAEGKVFFDISAKAQRQEIVAAQNKTAAKLDEMIKLLKSGEVKVQLTPQSVKELFVGQGGNNVPTQPKK